MAEFSWWSLANKLGNLLILIGACWYGIRTYLAPYALKILGERKHDLEALAMQAAQAVAEREKTIQAIQESREYTTLLLAKIEAWKEVLKEKEAAAVVARRVREQETQIYLKKRADGLCYELLKKEVTPLIIAQTTAQVRTFFKDTDHQKEYLATIMGHLNKGESRG